MKFTKFFGVLVTVIVLSLVPLFGQTPYGAGNVAPPTVASANSAVGPAGTVTASGLTITVSPGPIFCMGATEYVEKTTFVLPASSTTFISYGCAYNQVIARATSAVLPAEIPLATIVTGASTVSTNTDLRSTIFFPNANDGIAFVPFSDCAWTMTGTLGASTTLGILNSGASNTPVLQASTTAAGASTDTLSCHISHALMSKTTTLKGVTINDVVIVYGVQTTALTSVGAPTIGTIVYPTPGTSETASTVTPVTAGAVTVTPVIGSANLGLTTAGAFFTEKVALSTPLALTSDLTDVVLTQTFVQSAAAAQIVNIAGVLVHYQIVPL